MNSEYGIEKMPNLDELNNSKLKTTFVVDISNYKKNKIPISMSSRQNYFSTIYVNCTKNLGEKDKKMVISRVVGDKILSSKITEKKIRLNSMNTSSLSSLDMCNSTDSSDFTKNCFKNSSISQYGLNNINKNTENFLSISKIFVNGNNQNMTFMTLPKTKLNFKLKKDQENSIFYKSNSSKIQTERVPELDESQALLNGLKDSNCIISVNNNNNQNMSRGNQFTSISRTSRNSQNELTLPPIIESQVNTEISNVKKSVSRVDSGIANDYTNENIIGSIKGINGWTISTNGSEVDIEITKSSPRDKSKNKHVEITTVELIENSSGLKKNQTSSTFISYDRSQSNNSNSKINIDLIPNHHQNNEASMQQQQRNQRVKSSVKIKEERQPVRRLMDKRENTFVSINDGGVLNRRNSNTSDYYPHQSIDQKPVPKPRKQENRSTSLQRRETNSKISIENNKQILRQDSKPKFKQPNGHITLHRSNTNETLSRPKTGPFNTNNNNNNNQIQHRQINKNTQKPIVVLDATETKNKIENTNLNDTSIIETSVNKTDEEEIKESVDPETGLNFYTLERIKSWLKEIDNCSNMYKSTSQIDYSSSGRSDRNEKSERNANNHSNDYDLSDYDSLDEQIIEYNRVVDKTFHIIHED